jgi:hypothetical protein
MSGLDFSDMIEYNWIDIECPNCHIENSIQMIQVILESRILCRGCYRSIHLLQKDASGTRIQQSLSAITDALNALSTTLNLKI